MLITPAYQVLQAELHDRSPVYGNYGHKWGYLVAGICIVEGCRSILDYGCGKGTLARVVKAARVDIQQYDPGVREYARKPSAADLVVCVDVLEHIEPECLDDVLRHLRALTKRILFVAIAARPSGKMLADGRNAHLIVRDPPWWRKQLEEHGFTVRRDWDTGIAEWVSLLR